MSTGTALAGTSGVFGALSGMLESTGCSSGTHADDASAYHCTHCRASAHGNPADGNQSSADCDERPDRSARRCGGRC